MNVPVIQRQARGHWSRVAVPLACLLAVIAAGALSDQVLNYPTLWLFDAWQRLSPARNDVGDMVIIDIDADSVRRFGQWPWPRDRLAGLIDRAAGAKAIGVDILLLEPDRVTDGASDRHLAAAIARAPVVIAAAADPSTPPNQSGHVMSGPPIFQAGADAARSVPRVSAVTWPLAAFTDAAHGTGLTVVIPEPDGVLRRLPMLYAEGNALLPGFALEVMRVASKASGIRVTADPTGVRTIAIGQLVTRTDGNGAIRPHFSARVPAHVVSAFRVFDGDFDASVFNGRIVLIGSSLPGLGDVHITPLGVPRTGTAINAQLIASVFAGDTLSRPTWARATELATLAVLGGASLWLFGRLSDRIYATQATGVIVLLVVGSFTAFEADGILLDWIWPVSGLLAVNISALATRTWEEKRARRLKEVELAAALREIEGARTVVVRALNSTKLATLGELATVLAHELRQPLATISLAAENAELSLEDDSFDVSDARLRLNRIVAQANRARSIIDHLRVFGRSDVATMGPVDIHAAVADALVLVDPLLRKDGVHVRIKFEPDVPRVLGHNVLIEQVIVNLLINARDALAAIAAGRRAVDVAITTDAADRGMVRLVLTDTGPGIPPEVLPHVFDPFYTTKPAGEGTGLGLSICQRIIQSLGGSIAVSNDPSGGACFIVRLPAVANASPLSPVR